MGFFQKIIDFFLGLFGMKKKEPAQLSSGMSKEDEERAKRQAIKGLEHIEGAEHIRVKVGGKLIKQVEGASLVEDEDDNERRWVSQINLEVPRAAWVDEWGPIGSNGPDALAKFFFHEKEFEMKAQGDPLEAETMLLTEFGYRSVGHLYQVRGTMMKHYATADGPNVGDCVFSSQEVMNAAMKGAQMQQERVMQAKLAANPEILAPVEGVDVEKYARVAARIASGLPQDQLLSFLAEHGLDLPTWERANKEWTDRMSKDTTATIATIYGKAFMNSGTGQYGGAGQAAAAVGFVGGTAAGGGEPVPFDKFCEIQGAMSAWATTGQDVNALLKKTFDMTAVDWSNISTWWFSQMTADLSKMNVYSAKSAEYEAKYKSAQPKHDQDISF